MTKTCGYQGCNKEINVWQDFCQEHYDKIMKEQSKTVEMKDVPKPPELPETFDIKEDDMPVQQPKEITKKKTEKFIEITPEIALEFRKLSFTRAVDFVITQDLSGIDNEEILKIIHEISSGMYHILLKQW